MKRPALLGVHLAANSTRPLRNEAWEAFGRFSAFAVIGFAVGAVLAVLT